jgi:NADH-quinone oxidoreductase subunit I/NAD(P)H-quinone oxidoreductase subunit I
MGSIRDYFSAIGRSIVSLGDGFAVTLSYMFRKPNTLQYPDRSGVPVVTMLPERSRGLIEIDIEICSGCKACERACPIQVITIEVEKDDQLGRMLTKAAVDWSKCMFCGLCVDPCPTGSIRHSHEFEGGMRNQANLIMDFVDEPVPVAKVKKDEKPPTKPLGSIIRSRLPDYWAPPPAPRAKTVASVAAAAPEAQGGES